MVLMNRLLPLCLVVLLGACSSQHRQPMLVPGQPDATSISPVESYPDEPPPEESAREQIGAPAASNPARSPSSSSSQDKARGSALAQVLDRASAALVSQQWKQASRYLDQAQRMAPRNPRVYLLYGDYYKELGRWDQARAMYQRCLSVASPSSEWADHARYRLQFLP